MTYDVQCAASITLTERVEAATPEEAADKAHALFMARLKAGTEILGKDDLSDEFRVFDKEGNELELEDE